MKVLPLSFIWCMSFATMAITCMSFTNPTFWISLITFASACIYMGKNKDRLEREIDELFGE